MVVENPTSALRPERDPRLVHQVDVDRSPLGDASAWFFTCIMRYTASGQLGVVKTVPTWLRSSAISTAEKPLSTTLVPISGSMTSRRVERIAS